MDVNHLLTIATFERLLPAFVDLARRGADAERQRRPRRNRTVLAEGPDKAASFLTFLLAGKRRSLQAPKPAAESNCRRDPTSTERSRCLSERFHLENYAKCCNRH